MSRKLYPNVDFYSGLIYQAMGYPTDYFTVLFALGRLPGWIAQWEEMLMDPEQKISRPRQVYVGAGEARLPGPRAPGLTRTDIRPATAGAAAGPVSGARTRASFQGGALRTPDPARPHGPRDLRGPGLYSGHGAPATRYSAAAPRSASR